MSPGEESITVDQFMEAALGEARTGAAEGGIPIGAALVDGQGRLVATGRNRRVQDRAVVMHAEINCLFNAGKTVSDFRGMTVYSTLMPCNMCAGAIVQFGITEVIVGESENLQEGNGLELLQRHGVEVVDLHQHQIIGTRSSSSQMMKSGPTQNRTMGESGLPGRNKGGDSGKKQSLKENASPARNRQDWGKQNVRVTP